MNYISSQFAGPRIQGFSNAVEGFFGAYTPTISYFNTLSIDTANEVHTEMIGLLAGFPRPLIQKELLDATKFKFTVSYYRDSDIGFSRTYGDSSVGGKITNVSEASTLVYMDIPTYKKILKIVVEAMYNNRLQSLATIDMICKALAEENYYSIEWIDSNKNILITFYNTSTYMVYVAGYVLSALYDTMPNIVVTKETT